jgi:YHS domain-containing protein
MKSLTIICAAAAMAGAGCKTTNPHQSTSPTMMRGQQEEGAHGVHHGNMHAAHHGGQHGGAQAGQPTHAGHASHQGQPKDGHKGMIPMAFDQPPAEGTRARCPVTKEVFTVTKDSPRATHNGKHYAMCCAACKPKFEAAPGKYTAGSGGDEGHHGAATSSSCCAH